MEYIEGKPITDYAKAKSLSPHERVRLFQQVLAALDHAHRRLLIHRDLKPSNILVTDSGQVKIIDFGIAKSLHAESPATQTQARFFSPAHAAPEQLSGLANTVAVDIYQLGTVLYELISDQPVFDFTERTPVEIEQAIQTRVPKAPSTHKIARSGIDSDLDAICLHSLRKEANQRYPSVAAMQEDLHRALTHRPISIASTQWGYRTQKFLHRNRGAVAASLVIASLLAVFGWNTVQQNRRVIIERDRAVVEQKNAQAVTDFLVDSFTSMNPSQQWSPETKLGEVMKDMSLKLVNSNNLERGSRNKLALTLAEVFFEIGDSESATVALSQADKSANDATTALKLDVLNLSKLSANGNGHQVLEQARVLSNRKCDTPSVCDLIAKLLWLQINKSNSLELDINEKPVAELRSLVALGKLSPRVALSSQLLLIRELALNGDPALLTEVSTAISQFEKSTDLRQRAALSQMYKSRSIAYASTATPELGIPDAVTALKLETEIYGEQSRQARRALYNLAAAQADAGKLEESLQTYRTALRQMAIVGADSTDDLAMVNYNYGQLLVQKSEFGEAIRIFGTSLNAARDFYGSTSNKTLMIQFAFAKALLDNSQHAAATNELEKLLSIPELPEKNRAAVNQWLATAKKRRES